MTFIRYAISRRDLHALLRAIGVLRETESLLAVNNADLIGAAGNEVTILVSADAPEVPATDDLSTWTSAQLDDRYRQLALFELEHAAETERLRAELRRLQAERERRDATPGRDDSIPPAVDESLEAQIRRILGGAQPSSDH